MKNRRLKYYVMICILFLCAVFCMHGFVQAETKDITVNNGDYLTVSAYVCDTGKIMVNAGDLEVAYYEFSVDDDLESTVLEIGQDGTYSVKDSGDASVDVYGYDESGDSIFYAQVYFQCTIDMTNVTLKQSSVIGYMMPEYDGEGNAYYYGANVIIDIDSEVAIPEDMDVNVISSNSKYEVSAEIVANQIHMSISGSKSGTSVLTIVIANKTFTVNLQMKKVGISETSLLLGKKKSKTLKVTGYTGEVTWISKDKKIATVSKNGKVTAKKYGNTVILAKIGDQYLGCAVSVTTTKLIKVCARAEYIGRHWKYSQAKRTKKGYYDCSALVWKAYKQYTNIRFGSSGYPGTSASESAWCKQNKRVLKGTFNYNMVSKMKLRPGDLVFKSTNKKKKYSTTYHVEMLTGYRCVGVDSIGQPFVVCRWGARGAGYEYGISDGYIVARPVKY